MDSQEDLEENIITVAKSKSSIDLTTMVWTKSLATARAIPSQSTVYSTLVRVSTVLRRLIKSTRPSKIEKMLQFI